MTCVVKLSQLPISAVEFAERVKAHYERLVEYYHHLDGVRADAANPDLEPDEKRVAFPPPHEIDEIEVAIRRDQHGGGSITAHIDYQIEGPSLEEKKRALTEQVQAAERAAKELNLPAAKRRYYAVREQDIREADHMRIANHPSRVDDPDVFLRGSRPAEDTAFMDDYYAKLARDRAINRWGAKLEHDIADLTEDNVDAFVVTPFHG